MESCYKYPNLAVTLPYNKERARKGEGGGSDLSFAELEK